MRRLCIYVTYNKENQIKEYIGCMLKGLRKCDTKIFLVCNYPRILKGDEYVRTYVDSVFYRDNKGYDAGAFKDTLCSLIGWDTVYEYDELILVNDSFWGPFYDLDQLFALMEKEECDFWGMTRSSDGENRLVGHYKSHVQSYFLVFRNRVLKSSQFRKFWEEMKYPESYAEAIINYELKINNFLEHYGFKSLALTDVWGMTFEENENPIMLYPLELIRDQGLPILKKKSVLIANRGFDNAIRAIEFLQDNNLYPTDEMWEMVENQFNIQGCVPEGSNCLKQFYNKFKRIYIYGAGICSKNLILYFERKGWKQEGILVTDKSKQDIECMDFENAPINETTGIVIAVSSHKSTEAILQHIGARCKKEQLFLISESAAKLDV